MRIVFFPVVILAGLVLALGCGSNGTDPGDDGGVEDASDTGGDEGGTGDAGDVDTPAITLTELEVSGTGTVRVRAHYSGDTNANATVTMYYCQLFAEGDCDPLEGTTSAMERQDRYYYAEFRGIPDMPNPGYDYNFINILVEAEDPDGVTGSPMSTGYEIPIFRIEMGDMEFPARSETGFDVSVAYFGDHNENATVTLYFANETDIPGWIQEGKTLTCDDYPRCWILENSLADTVEMTRAGGSFTASVTGLLPPHDPGDIFRVYAFPTDPDGVRDDSWVRGYSTALTTLLNDAIDVTRITVTRAANSLDATALFRSDDNGDATITMYFCSLTADPLCDPLAGESLILERIEDAAPFLPGTYQAGVTPFPAPMGARDLLSVMVVVDDPDNSGGPITYQVESPCHGHDTGLDTIPGTNTSVAISGDYAARGIMTGSGSGKLHVFHNDNGNWVLKHEFSGGDNTFGAALAMDGNLMIVGEHGNDDPGPGSGAAYIYRFDGVDWAEDAVIRPTDPADYAFFGKSVALSEDIAVVGCPATDAVYVYTDNGGLWDEERISAPSGQAGFDFGHSVAIQGSRLVVGAPAGDSGLANVYSFDGSSWQEEALLDSGSTASELRYGEDVAVSDNLLIVSSTRSTADLYVLQNDEWQMIQRLGEHSTYCALTKAAFSQDVALLAVRFPCSPSTPNYGTRRSVTVFRFDTPVLVHQQLLIEEQSEVESFRLLFVHDIAMDADWIIAGAFNKSWTVDGTFWNTTAKIYH